MWWSRLKLTFKSLKCYCNSFATFRPWLLTHFFFEQQFFTQTVVNLRNFWIRLEIPQADERSEEIKNKHKMVSLEKISKLRFENGLMIAVTNSSWERLFWVLPVQFSNLSQFYSSVSALSGAIWPIVDGGKLVWKCVAFMHE